MHLHEACRGRHQGCPWAKEPGGVLWVCPLIGPPSQLVAKATLPQECSSASFPSVTSSSAVTAFEIKNFSILFVVTSSTSEHFTPLDFSQAFGSAQAGALWDSSDNTSSDALWDILSGLYSDD